MNLIHKFIIESFKRSESKRKKEEKFMEGIDINLTKPFHSYLYNRKHIVDDVHNTGSYYMNDFNDENRMQ